MTYANTDERAAVLSGLRRLAEFLDSNPAIPAPIYVTIHTFPPADDEWSGMTADIDAIAALLGVNAEMTPGGHYVAARSFGPVEYRAVAIPPRYERG